MVQGWGFYPYSQKTDQALKNKALYSQNHIPIQKKNSWEIKTLFVHSSLEFLQNRSEWLSVASRRNGETGVY
jgi:hypothetical protein